MNEVNHLDIMAVHLIKRNLSLSKDNASIHSPNLMDGQDDEHNSIIYLTPVQLI